ARTVASVKGLLGRTTSDPSVSGFLSSMRYKVVRGPNDQVVLEIDGQEISPVQIAAEMIDHLRRIAERQTATTIRQAVLSVPVAFQEPQRAALRRAAHNVAGLGVLGLLAEPIAGAMAYGYGQNKHETIAVYDFGGGTFDFSVLDLDGNDYRIRATGGDPWLGGDDFDLAIAQSTA